MNAIYAGSTNFSCGGEGLNFSAIFGSSYGDDGFFGGGGGGAADASGNSYGGVGGGGNGSVNGGGDATSGTANTGGGGGGRETGAAASGAGGSGIVLIGYDLSPGDQAPVLNAIGNKSVNEGTALSFTISASDADGDTLTYSASNLPSGATFDPATQTFSWTPGYSQGGVYADIRFEVSDGSLGDAEDITITVSDGDQADVNSDGAVNSLDMISVGQHWGEMGVSGWIPADVNKDGVVNVLDATLVGQHWTG